MAEINRRIVLAARPHGEPNASHFRIEEGRVPHPGEGEVLETLRESRRLPEQADFRAQTRSHITMLGAGAVLMLLIGLFAPASFLSHFIVFVLACFIGFSVIWNVAHSLHTPLMAITNAISSIVILGALLQIGSGSAWVVILGALAVLMTAVNIFGGFLVTRRMLAMFQKS